MQESASRDSSGLVVVLAAVIGILSLLMSCATGTVQTAYGPRPATEVQAQDMVADVLHSLDTGYAAAVAVHDDPATVASESAAVHAAHRSTLIKEHDGLIAAWKILAAWKQAAGSAYSPIDVVQPLVSSAPSFLDLAVSLKVMTREQADEILNVIRALFPAPITRYEFGEAYGALAGGAA